jgi:NlpC/P60 family/Bacterial dipeptidyl-peptidase Sh3 domain
MTTLDPRRHAFREDLADERLKGRVAAHRYVTGQSMQVGIPWASVRRKPGFEAPIDTEALHGEPVLVFERHEGWAFVQLETDGYVGYVLEAALDERGPDPNFKVVSRFAAVLHSPDVKSPGASLPMLSRLSGEPQGLYLRLCGGGFIPLAQVAAIELNVADFVAVAQSLERTPYRWGGKTPMGLDCSGLVQVSMQSAGLMAPRDSDMQLAEIGEAIDASRWSSLRRGDLIFWKRHVAIMVDGSHIVHANAHTMAVTIEPLAEAAARTKAQGLDIIGVRRPRALGREKTGQA